MGKQFYRAHLDITGKCNLRCVHCYASDRYAHQFSKEKLEWIMKELQRLDIQRIAISGGEPLLHPNLFDVI